MKQDVCPQCGSTNTVKGKQSGYGAVGKDTFLGGIGQALYHVFCADCGTLIRSYIKNPEKLK